ncbi:MAG: aa3-type cytochrome c oxidase subunit IV [Pseudomonadota bacterium]
MAEEKHEHGSMDIEVQEKTFESFVRITAYSIVGIFVFLILLYGING